MYYINQLTSYQNLQSDIKTLIPEMNMRRRMSRVVKMGTTTALECLDTFERETALAVDAIITATWLGCIADSEKFLSNMITAEEQMLNPTPFIQSTFNTVGAQVALLRGKHGYNNTFSQRHASFECALFDATLLLDSGDARAVLLGLFDEVTPTLTTLAERLGITPEKGLGEGAIFMVLTSHPTAQTVAAITHLEMEQGRIEENNGVSVAEEAAHEWCGAAIEVLAAKLQHATKGETFSLKNDIFGTSHSLMTIECW